MLDQITIVGNVGTDPELRYTPSGKAVCNFTLAANRTWRSPDGERHKQTIWYRCTAWGELAEKVVAQYIKKGKQVLVIGALIPNEFGNPRLWYDNQGHPCANFEVNVETLKLLGTKPAVETEAIAF